MKAIKFTSYLDAGGAIPPAVLTTDVIVGSNSHKMIYVLQAAYGEAYIYLHDDDDMSSAANSFCEKMTIVFGVWEEPHERTLMLSRIKNFILNNHAIHEEVQQKRPPVGGTDFETAYTDGGTVRDISGGSFPASLYNDIQDWKLIDQSTLDLFRPLVHFATPMSPECVEVWG